MPRDITITFSDGTKHQYNNTPDSVTPDDIEKRAKKDYPTKKISNISGGKKNPVGGPLSADPISANARPKGSGELDQVKKNAGLSTTPQSGSNPNLSQFSIKGLRFGMTVNEVVAITKSTEDDSDAYYADREKMMKQPDWHKQPTKYSHDYKKPVTSEYKSLEGFSIGGSSSWHPWYSDDKKLGVISLFINPDEFDEWFEKLSSQYGKPKNLTANEVGNLMGYKTRNIETYWDYQDVMIYLKRFSGKLTEGSVSIQWKKFQDAQRSKQQAEKEKRKKDFE